MPTYEHDAAGRRIIPKTVKQDVLRLVANGASRSIVATQYEITPKMIWKWEQAHKLAVSASASTTGKGAAQETTQGNTGDRIATQQHERIRELEKQLERSQMREAILKKALSIINPPA